VHMRMGRARSENRCRREGRDTGKTRKCKATIEEVHRQRRWSRENIRQSRVIKDTDDEESLDLEWVKEDTGGSPDRPKPRTEGTGVVQAGKEDHVAEQSDARDR
jgi:hypothetical protein